MEDTETKPVCAKCGSSRIMQKIPVQPYEQGTLSGGNNSLAVRLTRRGFLGISAPVFGDITARICANCGYTELFTDNLNELWETYGV